MNRRMFACAAGAAAISIPFPKPQTSLEDPNIKVGGVFGGKSGRQTRQTIKSFATPIPSSCPFLDRHHAPWRLYIHSLFLPLAFLRQSPFSPPKTRAQDPSPGAFLARFSLARLRSASIRRPRAVPGGPAADSLRGHRGGANGLRGPGAGAHGAAAEPLPREGSSRGIGAAGAGFGEANRGVPQTSRMQAMSK